MARLARRFPLRSLTVVALAIAAFALAGCGGSSAPSASSGQSTSPASANTPSSTPLATSPATTSTASNGEPAQAPPAGYQWVGIPSEKAWLAVPVAWVVLNPNDMSVQQALTRTGLTGTAATAMRAAFNEIKANHGIMVADIGSVATSPAKFATNVNMFCTASPIEPGPGAASTIESSMRSAYTKVGGHVLSAQQVSTSATSTTVEVNVDLKTPTGLTAHDLQFVEVTSQGKLCYTTFSTDRAAKFFPVFRKIAATVHIG